MSILVVAEKPSVARDIAKTLNCAKKGDGFLFGEGYVISWAIGHLVGLCEPEDYDAKYKKWSLNTLPVIPAQMRLKVLPKTEPQFNVLKRLMNADETTEIVCATDSGREGELIFRYIYSACGCKKPFKRLWISSMTSSAIKRGFANLKDGSEYDNLFKSARCRSEADWLVGINASRAYTVSYGVLLSIGRVQTPTLSIIVANKKEIENFKPEKYWETEAVFLCSGNISYKGNWFDPETNETKIRDGTRAEQIAARVMGKPSEVAKVSSEEKKTPPPLLFDLTELQRECNRKFGLTAKKTLEAAQNLYEKHKLITYPRTDSRYLTHDMAKTVRKVLESFNGELAELAKYPLSLPSLPMTKRIADDSKVTDHHAIIPTGKTAASLPETERKVFDLIARRLIASFYPYYRYSSIKAVTVSEGESFLSKGTEIIDPGWTSVLGRSEQKSSEQECTLPPLSEGLRGTVEAVEAVEKATSPPKPYTEATLLSAMENAGRFVEDEQLKEKLKESGLGTPATRAAIIERLIDVGYITRVKKTLTATEKGVKLIEIVPPELKSPETTAKWERALSQIAKGDMETDRFSGSIERYVRYIITAAKTPNRSVVFEKGAAEDTKGRQKAHGGRAREGLPSFGGCILCGGRVFENSKAFYCENWRDGCAFKLWKDALRQSGAQLTGELVKKLLKSGKADGIPVLLSSTGERGTCTLTLDKTLPGYIGISNFTRKEG